MWEALEHLSWVKTLSTTGWMYASVSVVHYLTMFWFMGSIAIVDLRVMGLAARKRDLAELADQLFPWAWTGFALAVISGFLMFATDAGDWAPDWVFHVKLTVIAAATIVAALIQWFSPRWAQAPQIPTWAKVFAFLSILLWIASILWSSEIPAMEGLG